MRVSRPALGIVVHVNCLLYPNKPASCGGAPLNILKSYIEQLTFSGALYPRAEVRGFAPRRMRINQAAANWPRKETPLCAGLAYPIYALLSLPQPAASPGYSCVLYHAFAIAL